MIALGIDAGASSSRWLLVRGDGSAIARGRAAPITGHVFTPEERARTLERVAELCRDVLEHGRPTTVAAGITGLDAPGPAADALAAALAEGLGIDRARVRVTHDMDVAFRAAFSPGEGVLVYAGTGSIAYHLPAEPGAEPLRVGGHGYLIDDAGGGYWIGQQALRLVLRERDRLGHPPATPLAEAVFAQVGGERWDLVREHVYGGGRAAVAAFAAVTGRAAEAGDPDAFEVLRRAGAELARLALVMFERLERRMPVALAGGVAHLGAPVEDGMRAALPPDVELAALDLEPVEAAARLAVAALGADSVPGGSGAARAEEEPLR